jgi:glycosyltransferase involved in cell wall biosynthesis
VSQVRNAIDPGLFHPPERIAPRRIAFMPRKRPVDARQVLRLLAAHGSLDKWDVVKIDGRSQAETARLLRSCAVFLSFSGKEGFGLPPAEAMACGCYVVGFPGLGGREYFHPEFCSPVPDDDILSFAKAAAEALADDPAVLAKRATGASAHILSQYTLEGQREDLLRFFGYLFGE